MIEPLISIPAGSTFAAATIRLLWPLFDRRTPAAGGKLATSNGHGSNGSGNGSATVRDIELGGMREVLNSIRDSVHQGDERLREAIDRMEGEHAARNEKLLAALEAFHASLRTQGSEQQSEIQSVKGDVREVDRKLNQLLVGRNRTNRRATG